MRMTHEQGSSLSCVGLLLAAFLILLPSAVGAEGPSEAEKDVLRANDAFYAAFRSRDMAAMDAIWSETDTVAVIHPGWRAIAGREQVMTSWRMILEGGASPDIRSREPKAYVYGDAAFIICYEEIDGGFLIATNVFVREGEAWRMVHHQAGPSPAGGPDASGKKI